MEALTLGVEEEYQIVDPQTRELAGRAEQILPAAQKLLGEEIAQPELYRSQIEIATSICQTLEEVRTELIKSRASIVQAAAQDGKAIAAAGTHPFSQWQQQKITPKLRYQELARKYRQSVRDLVIFGCHVHVGIADREVAIGIVNRARNWLSILLALSANSPFCLAQDTGYASYRTELWYRLPLTGPPLPFKDYAEYRALVEVLVATEIIEDATKIYWDVRLSEKFPTLEFRVTDVCLTVDEAVMIAGLTRGLVLTCYDEVINNAAFVPVRPELLRVAHWQAARYGLSGQLINPIEGGSVPAAEQVHAFLNYIRPALEKLGDWEEVASLVRKTIEHGNGAARQYQVYQRTGSYEAVVDYLSSQIVPDNKA